MQKEMKTIREAATALCDRWDTPLWKDAKHTSVLVHELRTALAQLEQEPVAWMCNAFDGKVCEQSNHDECENPIPLYTTPPKRERVVFPTMLRKMWSGGEVQAWLDENVNKEKNT